MAGFQIRRPHSMEKAELREAAEGLALSVGYFDFLGAPSMDAQTRRFFADVRWDH